MKKERLKQIKEALGDHNMSVRGLREESPVSEKLWNSKNDVVRLHELRYLVDRALKNGKKRKEAKGQDSSVIDPTHQTIP